MAIPIGIHDSTVAFGLPFTRHSRLRAFHVTSTFRSLDPTTAALQFLNHRRFLRLVAGGSEIGTRPPLHSIPAAPQKLKRVPAITDRDLGRRSFTGLLGIGYIEYSSAFDQKSRKYLAFSCSEGLNVSNTRRMPCLFRASLAAPGSLFVVTMIGESPETARVRVWFMPSPFFPFFLSRNRTKSSWCANTWGNSWMKSRAYADRWGRRQDIDSS